jgi:recombination protein RecR
MHLDLEYPRALRDIMDFFRKLPGIGPRTAERLTLALLEWPEEDLRAFGEGLADLRSRVRFCPVCGNFTDDGHCRVCRDPHRDRGLVCVVEHAPDIAVIERTGAYHGLYHVLGGKIVPLEGVGPEDLRIEELRDRLDSGEVREVVIATGSDVEGEATAAYLASELGRPGVVFSRIAAGMPAGADIAYADSVTLSLALSGRRPLGRAAAHENGN